MREMNLSAVCEVQIAVGMLHTGLIASDVHPRTVSHHIRSGTERIADDIHRRRLIRGDVITTAPCWMAVYDHVWVAIIFRFVPICDWHK